MPIQGTEADLMKLSMIEVDKKLVKYDAKILLQIHDSILVECVDSQISEVSKVIKTTMENVYPIDVMLAVDIETGKNWGNL